MHWTCLKGRGYITEVNFLPLSFHGNILTDYKSGLFIKMTTKHLYIYEILIILQQQFALSSSKKDYILSGLNIYEGSPKLWFRYIQTFLTTAQKHVGKSLTFTIHRYFLAFVMFDKYQRELSYDGKRMGESVGKSSPNVTVRKIYGVIKGSMATLPILHSYKAFQGLHTIYLRASVKLRFRMMFNINSLLSLNVTFTEINFPFYYCNNHVAVYNVKNLATKIKYCSKYHNIVFMLSYKDIGVEIMVDARSYMQYNVAGLFSIVDRNIMYSLPIQNTTDFKVQFEQVFLIKNAAKLIFLIIKVMIGYSIRLEKFLQHPNKIDIYDGPGNLSPILPHKNHLYKASTHYCTVNMLMMSITFHSFINYSSHKLKRSEVLHHVSVDIDLNLPNSKCKSNICIHEIKVNKGYKVNVTLKEMNITGFQSEKCLFGGMSATETIQNEFKEYVTLCTENNLPHRRYYSTTSSLKVILYWYKPYSSISVSLGITSTKCKAVQIAPSDFCSCLQTPPCNEYFKKITRYSHVSLAHSYFDRIEYSISHNECIVFQLRIRDDPSYCEIYIRPSLIRKAGSEVNYVVRGYFQQHFIPHASTRSHRESKDITILFNKNYVYDLLAFYGTVHLLCQPQSSSLRILKCKKNPSNSLHRAFYSERTREFSNTQIHVSGSFISPTDIDTFKVKVHLTMSLNNWIEITLQRKYFSEMNFHSVVNISNFADYTALKHGKLHEGRKDVLVLSLNKTKLDIVFTKVIIWLESPDIQMVWHAIVTFSNWNRFIHISLPGHVVQVEMKLLNKADTWINIGWIHDIYQKYHSQLLHVYKHKICSLVNMSRYTLYI